MNQTGTDLALQISQWVQQINGAKIAGIDMSLFMGGLLLAFVVFKWKDYSQWAYVALVLIAVYLVFSSGVVNLLTQYIRIGQ